VTADILIPHRRLHPLTPFLRSIRTLTVLVAALSWRGYADLGLRRFLLVVAGVLVLAIIFSVISWSRTGYEVINRELRIHEGVISRRTRAIPLERLQAVDLNRKVLPRALGLAELRLEVVSGGKSEAPLAYLSHPDALRLRDQLLALSRGAPPDPATLTMAPAAAPERLIHRVDNRDILLSNLLSPQVWAVPLGIAGLAAQFAYTDMFNFIAIASLATAVLGLASQPARRILADWNFQVARGEPGLLLRHGLLETRSQTVPMPRVQAVAVIRPFMWRPFGWLRARLDVAGYHGGDQNRGEDKVDRLLPVGRAAEARALVLEAIGVDLAALQFVGVPARARWLAPLAAKNLAAALTPTAVAARSGWLSPQTLVVRYSRIQSVRVRQGPVQRLFRLASVYVDTAGGLVATLEHRDTGDAYRLAALLADHARIARRIS
jgi:putative membrane protein